MWNICLYVYTCILYMWMYVAAKHGKLYNISFPATGKKKSKEAIQDHES